jgi:hypothetical protein
MPGDKEKEAVERLKELSRKLAGDPPEVALEQTKTVPLWLKLVVLLGALLMMAGGVLALANPAIMVSRGDQINSAVRIFAGYLASRNLVLAVMLLAALGFGARRALGHLMLLVALVQFLDVVIDCVEARWIIVPGVLVLGILFLIGANRLLNSPFWSRGAWSD